MYTRKLALRLAARAELRGGSARDEAVVVIGRVVDQNDVIGPNPGVTSAFRSHAEHARR